MFANAPAANDKRLGVVVGRAAGTNLLAKPGVSLSLIASRGARTGASSGYPSFGHGLRNETPPSAMPSSPETHYPRDHSRYGA